MSKPEFEPLRPPGALPEAEMIARARAFRDHLRGRRTVRDFSDRAVPRALIEAAIEAAGSAPSGANLQPWHFVAIADPAIKREIRRAAEEEERAFYGGRAPQEWLEALAPLGTDEHKPFLETAPWLIAIFAERNGRLPDGRPVKHYYVPESVGIATGFLIAALHEAGLVTLTHTPSPMGFLNRILKRPENEKPYILLVAGHPAEGAMVPRIGKKRLDEIASWL
ncbi:MAG: nitroreductase family protein [Alphaproteobacteria bacterium]|nr:nitroreductase family protein [Alphaproteobacteria bacterium]